MATERRFETAFRESEADAPGLVLGDNGVVYLVAPDGTRTALGGGSSSAVFARVHLAALINSYGGGTIPFDVVDVDSDGLWDAANHQYTAQTAGWYEFGVYDTGGGNGIVATASSTPDFIQIYAVVFGPGANVYSSQFIATSGDKYCFPPFFGHVHLEVGNSLVIQGDGGAGWQVDSDLAFTLQLVSAD